MNMRLLGARTMEEVTEDMVDAQAVGWHDGGGVPQDHMFTSNCASASSLSLRDVPTTDASLLFQTNVFRPSTSRRNSEDLRSKCRSR